jgi:two-component system sensor histidine kinase KdpD
MSTLSDWRSGAVRGYLGAAALVAAATGASALLHGLIAPTNLVMLYLLAVVVTGLRFGQGPAAFASLVGVLSFDFFFVPPHLTFRVSDAEYVLTFLGFLAVGLVSGALTGRLRAHVALLERRERQTALLYAFSQALVAYETRPAIAQALVRHVADGIGQPALLLEADGTMTTSGRFTLRPDQMELAQWSLATGEPAGWPDSPRPGGEVGILPLLPGSGKAEAVLVVRQREGRQSLAPDGRRVIATMVAQAAGAFRRVALAEEARQARLLAEAEKLHDALLHSVSHALKTPLVSVIGALSALRDPAAHRLDPWLQQELIEGAAEEAERLHHLVSELLDMTRLQSGYLRLNLDWFDLADLVGAALDQAQRCTVAHPIEIDLPDDLPLLYVDQVLLIQVLENLITNACKYSPPGAPVRIEARVVDPASGAQPVPADEAATETVEVGVLDRGAGIPLEHRERIFERFYRLERPGDPFGTGLGLAIARGLVEAHGGRIWVEGRPGGGAAFRFTLPVRPAPTTAKEGDE